MDAALPAEKVVVKPNFVDPDPGARERSGTGAAFVGRFWPEKGVRTSLDAWHRLTRPVTLEIRGMARNAPNSRPLGLEFQASTSGAGCRAPRRSRR